MAPSSLEATGPEVPDECPLSRGAMVYKFQMHAYSWVSPGVGQCATSEVVQFFVCCGTFVLSVGLLFFSGVVFSQAIGEASTGSSLNGQPPPGHLARPVAGSTPPRK